MPANVALRTERAAVCGAVVLTGVLFLTNTADPVNVPKLAALLLVAVVACGASAITVIRTRVVQLPWGLPAAAGAALLGGFAIAALVAPQATTAVLGTYGRNSGLLAYAAALVLYGVVLRSFDRAATKLIAFAVLLAGSFTATYGLLQRLGVDAVHWNNPFNPIIAGLGNPDFASAYLGIAVPVAVWAACWTGWGWAARGASAAVAALCFVVALLSSAVQGPLAALAGLVVVALALALDLRSTRRRAAVASLATITAIGLVVLLLGARGSGPARTFFTGISYDARTWYWRAAATMWQRSPLTGIGLDSYGLYWRRDRPVDNPRTVGGDSFSDSAHSVPLQHLAQGGLLLAAAYLLFVAVVVIALFRGMRKLTGQDRLLLGGLGGAWSAYQVQSLVSIDQVPLLVLNYVLAAAVVVAAGGARLREIRLPGALVVAAPGGRRGRQQRAPQGRVVRPLDHAACALVAVVVLGGSWAAVSPLRASHAAFVGDRALNAQDGDTAVRAFSQAVDLVPGLGRYRTSLGQTYNLGGRQEDARRTFASAFAVDPGELNAARTAARLAATAGDVDAARRLFTRAVELDPLNSSTILDWAEFELANGGTMAVRTRLQQGVRDLPQDAGLWATLGDARAALKDSTGARDAYQHALALKPDEPKAKAGLAALEKAGG